MTISSSLNAGVSGLSAHASRLAGIADNIANSATEGYRRVVTDFASLAVGDSPSLYVAGGVRSTSLRLIDEAGPLTGSNNATDIAVSGRGMLPVTMEPPPPGGRADTPLRLTSTGAFRPDAEGILRDPKGQVLLGWPAAADGTIPDFPRQSVAGLEAVRIQMGFAAGEATDAIEVRVNLPATATAEGQPGDPYEMNAEYYDALGALQSLSLSFAPQLPAAAGDPPTNAWRLTVKDGAQNDAVVGEYDFVFDDTRGKGGTLASVNPITGGYADGALNLAVAGGPMALVVGEIGRPGGLTQLADRFVPTASRVNGAPAGSMDSIEVLPDGTVRAITSAGVGRTLYRVPLVDVANPNGLKSETGSTFSVSTESGPFYLWDAGEGPTGRIEGFSRQESATDVAGELTDLIQTQRAYSSNAKIIQTVDEMLQETANLKR